MSDPRVVLSVEGLRAGYDNGYSPPVTAVRDVSFDLHAGEKLAIVGESGCGKSTLALALLGLLESPGRVLGGAVRLNGRDISRLREREKQDVLGKEISLIFQDPMSALDPVATIGSQVTEGIRRHQPGVSRKAAFDAAVELLQEVEIPNAARRMKDYPHQYSGGMRQRVMIAIALANRPSVIIADEPTTALDVTTQAQVLDVLGRLVTERGIAVILITHNLGIVGEFCDAVRVMYAGRFVESGEVASLFARPAHPYTRALLDCIPRPGSRGPLPSISGFPPPLEAAWDGCSFEPRCPVGSGHATCRALQPPVSQVTGRGARHVAECHFAGETSTPSIATVTG